MKSRAGRGSGQHRCGAAEFPLVSGQFRAEHRRRVGVLSASVGCVEESKGTQSMWGSICRRRWGVGQGVPLPSV